MKLTFQKQWRIRWRWLYFSLLSMRESLRDRWLIIVGRPLYFRCRNFVALWRPCRNDATWTYVGDDRIEGPDVPIECDACHTLDGPSLDDRMMRVGRWYRAPVFLSDPYVRKSLSRSVGDV